jgi:ABC-type branched-subunit amino acid transport system substrate-binding protein
LYSINDEPEKVKNLEKALENELHEVGSVTYPAIAYDSYWVASQSLYKNSSTLEKGNDGKIKSFKQIVFDTANKTLDSLSGKIILNKAGDRTSKNYDFWFVTKDESGYKWKKEKN